MAEFDYQSAVAFGAQAGGLGAINTTIRDLSGSINSASGVVLGSTGAGIADDGIDDEYNRELREKPYLADSYTRPPSDFLREIATMTFTFPFKGNGNTISGSPADSEFEPIAGVDAILQAAGLTGAAWGTGIGWSYVPADAVPMTVKRFGPGFAWVYQDCFASLSIPIPGGSISDIVATILIGSVAQFPTVAFPTVDYQLQASVSAAAVEALGHNWGISAATRGFAEGVLTIDPEIEEVENVNAVNGRQRGQTGRAIEFNGIIWGDSGDIDFEHVELVRTTAPTEAQTFQIGTAAGTGVQAKAIKVTLASPELRKLKPQKMLDAWAVAAQLRAVDETADTEFEMIFL